MQQARINIDLVFVLIALGWVAVKFLGAYREQQKRDAEAARRGAGGARPVAPPPPAAAAADEEWRPFDAFPEFAPPPAGAGQEPSQPVPPVALPAPARAVRPRPVLRRVQSPARHPSPAAAPAHLSRAALAPTPIPSAMPEEQASVPAPPRLGEETTIAGAAGPVMVSAGRQRTATLRILRQRGLGERRMIRLQVMTPGAVRQAVILSEVVGRPRAFDL